MARSQSLCILLIIVALHSAVSPQSISALPDCGQTCVNNMLALAPSLGCSAADLVCLCKNVNLAYGIRDCANAACDAAGAATTIAYGNSLCSSTNSSSSSTTASPSGHSSSSSATSTISTPSSSSSSSSSPSTTTSPSSSNSNSQSLSSGAKAGIGVGVAIGLLILCLLIYIAILLRRRGDARSPAKDTTNNARLPELGPGLLPEMAVVEKPGELSTEDGQRSDRKVNAKEGVTSASELPS